MCSKVLRIEEIARIGDREVLAHSCTRLDPPPSILSKFVGFIGILDDVQTSTVRHPIELAFIFILDELPL